MVLRTRRTPVDDSPIPGVIPGTVHVVRGEPPEENETSAARRRKAARQPLISHARAVWSRRRTDRP